MSEGILNIEPHIVLTTIEIWHPRYNDNIVLVAKKKIRDHNRIIFTKAKSLKGKEFYISGVKAKKFKSESNGSIACRAIPLEELTEMKIDRRFL